MPMELKPLPELPVHHETRKMIRMEILRVTEESERITNAHYFPGNRSDYFKYVMYAIILCVAATLLAIAYNNKNDQRHRVDSNHLTRDSESLATSKVR